MGLVINRSVIHLSLGVNMSNPNGNTDNGDPRRTCSDRGLISTMSIKRKIRDLLENHSSIVTRDIIGRHKIDMENCHIFESRSRGFDNYNSENEAFKKAMDLCRNSEDDFKRRYIDIRLFGGTILENNKDKGTKKGKKNEEKRVKFTNRGVVQADMFESIRPIETVIGGITRKASTDEKNQEGFVDEDGDVRDGSAGMVGQGGIKVVRNAIYTGAIRISPHDAIHLQTSEDDITLLKGLMPYLFLIGSAQRTGCEVLQAICIEHPDSLGVLPDHLFLGACAPTVLPGFDANSPSESFKEYSIPTVAQVQESLRNHRNFDKVKITDLLA